MQTSAPTRESRASPPLISPSRPYGGVSFKSAWRPSGLRRPAGFRFGLRRHMRRWLFAAMLATASASTLGEASGERARPTCERSGRGCSERERAFLYHFLAADAPKVRAERERLVRSLAGGLQEPARHQWIDQRLHILDQLGVHGEL
mmetsp:Transcript_25871/g.63920  ORF Transcript_25871/g.63920 Transcript_25871/m.63920 type:complete len:147 (-) Transcript_25871:218-658(-)